MTEANDLVDAHVHLWDPRRLARAWTAGTTLDRPFLAIDYQAASGPDDRPRAYLCVEAGPAASDAVAEAAWIREQANLDPRIAGFVGQAPVELGARGLSAHLGRLRDACGGLLRGVRRDLQAEPDRRFGLRRAFLDGLRLLPAHGLPFDICVSHDQLPVVLEIVRQCPDTSFVLDHLGKPPVASGALDPWRSGIEALAAMPNVTCKVSGLLTEARPGAHRTEVFAPYLEHAFGAFGESRILFGSDWPVMTRDGTPGRWLAIVREVAGRLSPAAQAKLFMWNTTAVYGLDPPGNPGTRRHDPGLTAWPAA